MVKKRSAKERSKKGVSPLIATVLVLGLTIALAVIIINWGQKFVTGVTKETEKTTTEKLSCVQNVDFDITKACQTGNAVTIIVNNNGDIPINKFRVRAYRSDSDVEALSIDAVLEAFGRYSQVVTVTSGPIKKVDLIPIITVGNKPVTCSQNVEEFGDLTSDLPAC